MWPGPTFQTYYGEIERKTRAVLNQEHPDYLLGVDFDEYLDYLMSEAKWEPLEWHEDQITVEPFSTKVKRQLRKRSYFADEPGFRLRIPVSPHPKRIEYFRFGPSTTWANRSEPQWRFEGDVLIHEVEATEQAAKEGIETVRFWLGGRNKDIEAGNADLRERIHRVWENKRTQLEQQHGELQAVLQKLNIPLHRDPNAKAGPIEIKPRQLRTVMDKPKAEAREPVPALERDDVVGLVDFIEGYVREFEIAPETYVEMGEEKLRNLLVAMMNANYKGSTTGETFSKLGKTDISMRVDAGHVLICECKFWMGAKAYAGALDQLFRYLTWRENHGVLIHFCTLKDMTRALFEGKKAVQQHPTFTAGTVHDHSETRFVSRHVHPQDADKSVEIHHLFVDLSV